MKKKKTCVPESGKTGISTFASKTHDNTRQNYESTFSLTNSSTEKFNVTTRAYKIVYVFTILL